MKVFSVTVSPQSVSKTTPTLAVIAFCYSYNKVRPMEKVIKVKNLCFIFSATDPVTRQCPNLGRYEIVSVMDSRRNDHAEDKLGVDGEQDIANAAEVQDVRVTTTPYPVRCRYGSVRRLDIGCKTPDRMEFATSCSNEAPSGKIFP